MRITEGKLRSIVRSVIRESSANENNPYRGESFDEFKVRLGLDDNRFKIFYLYVHDLPARIDTRIEKTHGWGARDSLYANATYSRFTGLYGQERLDRILDNYIKEKYNNYSSIKHTQEHLFYIDLLDFYNDGEPMGPRNGDSKPFWNVINYLVRNYRKKEAEGSRNRGGGIEGIREKEKATLTVSFLKQFVYTLEKKLDKISLEGDSENV